MRPPGIIWHLGWLAVCAGLLLWNFLTLEATSKATSFGFTLVIAFAAGLLAHNPLLAIERRKQKPPVGPGSPAGSDLPATPRLPAGAISTIAASAPPPRLMRSHPEDQ